MRAAIVAAAATIAAPAGGVEGDPPAPVRVTVGVFLNNIPAIDLAENSFTFDAYVWFRWDAAAWPPPRPGATAGPADAVEADVDVEGEPVLHGPARTFEVIGLLGELSRVPLYSGPGYCCAQIKGERHTFWDVRHFPFDCQRLSLIIEDGSYEADQLVYEPDDTGSGTGPDLQVTGFRLDPHQQWVSPYVYDTTFGDPRRAEGEQSTYSRYEFTLPVRHESLGLFLKLFIGLLVCTAVALIALFINATQVDPRFGLCVGGLFGIIGSGYLVSSLLPKTAELCYSDNLHNASLIVVLVVILESAFSLSFHLNDGEAGARRARRLDRATFAVLAIAYAATALALTWRAIG